MVSNSVEKKVVPLQVDDIALHGGEVVVGIEDDANTFITLPDNYSGGVDPGVISTDLSQAVH